MKDGKSPIHLVQMPRVVVERSRGGGQGRVVQLGNAFTQTFHCKRPFFTSWWKGRTERMKTKIDEGSIRETLDDELSEKDFLGECSKWRHLKKCMEVWCRGSQAFYFPEPFPRILLFSLLWLSSWNVKRESIIEDDVLWRQPFSTANYFISITIDIINEEWCIELNLNLKNAWM